MPNLLKGFQFHDVLEVFWPPHRSLGLQKPFDAQYACRDIADGLHLCEVLNRTIAVEAADSIQQIEPPDRRFQSRCRFAWSVA
jgi:hypothetical protein